MPATKTIFEHGGFDRNPTKNRHKNVLCFDATRIELKDDDDGSSIYVHANELHLPNDCLRYVLTQMPLRNTVNDFWRMIWQLKPLTVVALCQPTRDEERYVPCIGQNRKYGKINVSRDIEVDSSDWWTVVELNVGLTSNEDSEASEVESFSMRYLMWYEWTHDVEIPDPDRMLAFVQELHIQTEQEAQNHERSRESRTDVLLVCSTGAVRSGLVAAASALSRAISDNAYNPDQIVRVAKQLRETRHRTIDTFSQFAYMHYFVLNAAAETPDLTIDDAMDAEDATNAVKAARRVYAKIDLDEKMMALRPRSRDRKEDDEGRKSL